MIGKGELDLGMIYLESFSRDLGRQLYFRGYLYSSLQSGEEVKEIEEMIARKMSSKRIKSL